MTLGEFESPTSGFPRKDRKWPYKTGALIARSKPELESVTTEVVHDEFCLGKVQSWPKTLDHQAELQGHLPVKV